MALRDNAKAMAPRNPENQIIPRKVESILFYLRNLFKIALMAIIFIYLAMFIIINVSANNVTPISLKIILI